MRSGLKGTAPGVVATDDAGESNVSMSKMLVGEASGCLALRGVGRGAMVVPCLLRQKLRRSLQVATVCLVLSQQLQIDWRKAFENSTSLCACRDSMYITVAVVSSAVSLRVTLHGGQLYASFTA